MGEEGLRNINPDDLNLSQETTRRLLAWAQKFDDTLDRKNPAASGFRSEKESEAFARDGHLLWTLLKNELGPEETVVYFCHLDSTLHEWVEISNEQTAESVGA